MATAGAMAGSYAKGGKRPLDRTAPLPRKKRADIRLPRPRMTPPTMRGADSPTVGPPVQRAPSTVRPSGRPRGDAIRSGIDDELSVAAGNGISARRSDVSRERPAMRSGAFAPRDLETDVGHDRRRSRGGPDSSERLSGRFEADRPVVSGCRRDWRRHVMMNAHTVKKRAGREPMSDTKRKTPEELRSARWFAPDDLRSFGHRSRLMQLGYAEEDFMGKPIIGILNTWSELNSCHGHFPERVEGREARRRCRPAASPVELPTLSRRRELHQAHLDALPQHAGDGDRGDDPLAPARRRGADGRLRQDHARASSWARSPPACR